MRNEPPNHPAATAAKPTIPFLVGYLACQAGKKPADNPFPKYSQQAIDWHNGGRAAASKMNRRARTLLYSECH